MLMERCKKRGRPKGSKNKQSKTLTFDWNLRGMKPWDIYYTRKFDKDITSRIATLGLSGTFKTERVLLVKMKSWETERGTLITKLGNEDKKNDNEDLSFIYSI